MSTTPFSHPEPHARSERGVKYAAFGLQRGRSRKTVWMNRRERDECEGMVGLISVHNKGKIIKSSSLPTLKHKNIPEA